MAVATAAGRAGKGGRAAASARWLATAGGGERAAARKPGCRLWTRFSELMQARSRCACIARALMHKPLPEPTPTCSCAPVYSWQTCRPPRRSAARPSRPSARSVRAPAGVLSASAQPRRPMAPSCASRELRECLLLSAWPPQAAIRVYGLLGPPGRPWPCGRPPQSGQEDL